jgi:hypothetical protein
MKKFMRWLLIVLGSLLALLVIAGVLVHESRPESRPSPAADSLARRMQRALGADAWEQTRWAHWSFPTGAEYLWDKERQLVEVRWKDYRVVLHTPSREGVAFRGGNEVKDPEARAELLASAWRQFANDSFWFCAPFKVFDPGTRRSVITDEDGQKALLVEYTSGGVTPGDAYLWHLDEDDRPVAWQMWVQILPVGGLGSRWEQWQSHGRGVLLAHERRLLGMGMHLQDIQLDEEIPAVAAGTDPLAAEAAQLLPVGD